MIILASKADWAPNCIYEKAIHCSIIDASHPPPANNTISHVERLLETPLTDYRKSAISLILAPYFVNIQKLSNSDS